MHSRTKVSLPETTVTTLVRTLLPDRGAVTEVRELTAGMFNAGYAVTCADGSRAMLKIAPPDDVPVLSYEHGLMRTEADFFQRSAGVIPAPTVLAYDTSRTVVDREVLVLGFLDGAPLNTARRSLSSEQRAAVQRELGGVVARLSTITGTRFGYDRTDGSLSGDTWSGAFEQMVTAVLTDAEHYRVRLPRSARNLPDSVRRAAADLDVIQTPSLVHFDMWQGNIFVRVADGIAGIEGVIDGERAFWGDALADLVSTALFGDPRRDSDFLAGYGSAAGQPLDLGPAAQLRLAFYRAYLDLIMIVEGAPRGYRGLEQRMTRAYVRSHLARQLRAIGRAAG